MKLKNTLVALVASALACGGFTSCESYLDVDKYFYDMTSLDSIFARKQLLTQYINQASSLLPHEEKIWSLSDSPFAFTSDESFASFNDGNHRSMKYPLGEVDRFYYDKDVYWSKAWKTLYQCIRKANVIIARIGECKDITEMERRDYTGQAYFLRGYSYYCLVRQYGPVPVLPDQAFETNETSEVIAQQRNTYDECIEYICKNLETAASLLETERADMATYRIPTSKAALALVSRIRLEAASTWFNGNRYYYDFIRSSDGVPYFSQTKDPRKWAIAAVAAKRVINMAAQPTDMIYTVPADIYTPQLPSTVSDKSFPDGAGNIDPFKSYNDMFTGEETAINIPEIIWAATPDNSYLNFSSKMGGWGGLGVNQKLVDAYRMANGHDIKDEGSGYPIGDQVGEANGKGASFSGYQLSPNVANMYMNREMRFYASIGFNYTYWEASSYQGSESQYKNQYITYFKDGTGAANADHPEDRSMTGYVSRKYIHYSDSPKGTLNRNGKYFPIIRYAEVLLNYVEALNEMEGSYTDETTGITVTRDPEEMCKYFNMIRYRAGLPGITQTDAEDRTRMLELIKRERQVEFAFEGRRFFDLRRWGDLEKETKEPFYGMNIDAKIGDGKLYYQVTPVTFRYSLFMITNKLALYPINQTTIDKNPKLDQNPGW